MVVAERFESQCGQVHGATQQTSDTTVYYVARGLAGLRTPFGRIERVEDSHVIPGMKKPPQGRLGLCQRACYDAGMSFTDYMWIKLIVLGVIAFCLGAYAEFKGKSIEEVLFGQRDRADRQNALEQTKDQRRLGD